MASTAYDELYILVKPLLDKAGLNATKSEVVSQFRRWGEDAGKEFTKGFVNYETWKAVRNTITGLFIGGLAARGVASMFKSYMSFETSQLQYGQLLGNQQKGNDLFELIKNRAVTSPYNISDYQQSTGMLVQTGKIKESNYLDMEDRIANLAMGSADRLYHITKALTDTLTQANANAKDMVQFTNAGVPIYQYLGKALAMRDAHFRGVPDDKLKSVTPYTTAQSREMVGKREVGGRDVVNALILATEQGSAFYKAQEKMSDTLETKTRNLGESYSILSAKLVTDVTPALKKALGGFQEMITWTTNSKLAMDALGFTIATVGGSILTVLGAIAVAFSASVLGVVGGAVGATGAIVGGIGYGISKVISHAQSATPLDKLQNQLRGVQTALGETGGDDYSSKMLPEKTRLSLLEKEKQLKNQITKMTEEDNKKKKDGLATQDKTNLAYERALALQGGVQNNFNDRKAYTTINVSSVTEAISAQEAVWKSQADIL